MMIFIYTIYAIEFNESIYTMSEMKGDYDVPKYKFFDPDGQEWGTNNLTKFCKTHNLNYQCMLWINNGRRKKHKGWYK